MISLLWEKHPTEGFNYGKVRTRLSSEIEMLEIQARAVRGSELQREWGGELAGGGDTAKMLLIELCLPKRIYGIHKLQ